MLSLSTRCIRCISKEILTRRPLKTDEKHWRQREKRIEKQTYIKKKRAAQHTFQKVSWHVAKFLLLSLLLLLLLRVGMSRRRVCGTQWSCLLYCGCWVLQARPDQARPGHARPGECLQISRIRHVRQLFAVNQLQNSQMKCDK